MQDKMLEETIKNVNEVFSRRGRRNPARIDRILEKLGCEWKKFPDQRLGQLYENLRVAYGATACPFYWEDDDLEKALDSRDE